MKKNLVTITVAAFLLHMPTAIAQVTCTVYDSANRTGASDSISVNCTQGWVDTSCSNANEISDLFSDLDDDDATVIKSFNVKISTDKWVETTGTIKLNEKEFSATNDSDGDSNKNLHSDNANISTNSLTCSIFKDF